MPCKYCRHAADTMHTWNDLKTAFYSELCETGKCVKVWAVYQNSRPQCVALLSLLAGSKGHGLHARVLTTFHLHICASIYINIYPTLYILPCCSVIYVLRPRLLLELCTAKNDVTREIICGEIAGSLVINSRTSHLIVQIMCVMRSANGMGADCLQKIRCDGCETRLNFFCPQAAVNVFGSEAKLHFAACII